VPHSGETSLDICAYDACGPPQHEIPIFGVPASSDCTPLASRRMFNTDHCWGFSFQAAPGYQACEQVPSTAWHSIRSKSTRFTKSGVIVNPHFGHVLSSEASTFSKLIFRDRGTRRNLPLRQSKSEDPLFWVVPHFEI
jgi:hypothetical protein